MKWDELIAQGQESTRDIEAFDSRERNYKVQIAAAIRQAMEAARDGAEWQELLRAAFSKRYEGQDYNLTYWEQHLWLTKLEPEAQEPTRAVLASFLSEEDPLERYRAYEDLAKSYAGKPGSNPGSVLGVGSVLNFAVDTYRLPILRWNVVRAAEKEVGYEIPEGGGVAAYKQHLEFVEAVKRELVSAGVNLRDTLDAQSIIWEWSSDEDKQPESGQAGGQPAGREEFTDNELVLLLDFYLRRRDGRTAEIDSLRESLLSLPENRGREQEGGFRTLDGIRRAASRFGAFEEPPLAELDGPRAKYGAVWRRYADEPERLSERIAELFDSGGSTDSGENSAAERSQSELVAHLQNEGRRAFIENTKTNHQHGGKGWEFGTCLWSPTLGKGGRKIYQLMLQPKPGDLVFHILDSTLAGISRVAESCRIVEDDPPSPGAWAGMAPYFRIDLNEFYPAETPVSLEELYQDFEEEILGELALGRPPHYLFVERDGSVRMGEGNYLTEATPTLLSILQRALAISSSAEDIESTRDAETNDSREEYREERRMTRERYYFARHPGLAREAKERYGYTCQVCGFDFQRTYGELGRHYVECHHLNPLSERSEEEQLSGPTTSVDEVVVVCANCHRMIHRKRPALSPDEVAAAMVGEDAGESGPGSTDATH